MSVQLFVYALALVQVAEIEVVDFGFGFVVVCSVYVVGCVCVGGRRKSVFLMCPP